MRADSEGFESSRDGLVSHDPPRPESYTCRTTGLDDSVIFLEEGRLVICWHEDLISLTGQHGSQDADQFFVTVFSRSIMTVSRRPCPVAL